MRFLLFLILISLVLNIDFKKNSDILKGRKFQPRLMELENLNQLKDRLDLGRNALVLFYADWCHHCKEFHPKFQVASQYEMTQDFDFIAVNCKNKEICDAYSVHKFPTTKVFVRGKEIGEEPPRETEGLLEFIDKISHPPILQLTENALRQFSVNYGEVTFLILEENEDSDFFKCVKALAEGEYLSLLYFGHLKKKSFTTKSGVEVTAPALITLGSNEEYNLIFNADKNFNCEDMKEFIGINKYPLMKRLNINFIRRLQAEKRTLVISAIDNQSPQNLNFLNSVFKKAALKYRNYVFSHLDYNEDRDLLSSLRIYRSDNPAVVIYNFSKRRFYSDKNEYSENDKENEVLLNDLLQKLERNELKFSAGNWFEDFLESLGFQLNHTTMVALIVGCFGIICIIFMIVVFYCGDANEQFERSAEQAAKERNAENTKKQEESKTESKKDK